MILTVCSYKGGVGKTTSAIHLACYLQERDGDCLLIDGDPNRSCLAWSKRGSLPFSVVDEKSAVKHVAKHKNIVIDTAARPDRDELAALIEGCDLMLLPSTPDAMALEALRLTVQSLKRLSAESYRVLLTIVPPRPSRDGIEARDYLAASGVPVLNNYVRRWVAFQRASLMGVPVYESRDRNGGIAWADYKAVGEELFNA